MAAVFRWLLRGFLALAVLALAAVGIAYWFLARSLTDPDGRWVARGVSAPVEIVRDVHAIPHVFGETDEDVFFGLGFAHAQDRLWQMTLLRRTVQGRLSELFGAETLQTDALMRRLDLAGAARASVPAQDPATRAMLEAYADGVNAWIAEVDQGALGRGAPEFFFFEPAIAAWSPADSIAILKLLALQLSPHLEAEVLRARLSLLLEDEGRVDDLLPEVPGPGLAALPPVETVDYGALAPGVAPDAGPLRHAAAHPLSPFRRMPFAGASNAFAAGPERAASGGALLANDPHMALTAPTPWYLARLDLRGGAVIGGTIPGVPAVLAGRSDRMGWGVTASYADDVDVHLERVDPEDSSRYRTPEGWAPFAMRDSIVRVADGAPVTLRLRWTANGPVMTGDLYDLASITPEGHVMSVAWPALSREDTSMTAARRLMAARDVGEGIEAGALFLAPTLNLTLADADGAVALKTVGALPRRDAGHATLGRMPSPGWVEANRWQGTLPYATNPEFVDPPGGIVGNTNNKTVDRPFPTHVSYIWGDAVRVNRWRTLMQRRAVHTRESFVEAQLDTVSQAARVLLPLIGAELFFTGEAAAEGTPERQRRRAIDLLAEWNGEMSEHRPEPLIYAAWLRALQQRLIRDEIGPLAGEFPHPDPIFLERVFRDVGGAGQWCDILQSAPEESCADIARIALDDALVWIAEHHPGELESVRWGDAHQATHDHPVLGQIPVVRWLVNIRQSTSGGNATLMRGRTRGGAGDDAFENVHAATYRGVYDFADPDASIFVTSTGQSGHPLSRHYEDLGQLWRRGEYVPMILDPALARAGAEGVTVIAPPSRPEG
ncbi:penicillin amidase [Hasllibacter halocynthiae]|uniref:Penicillin amidase n=1 Tax=Hasllibacter halocynthiae TaxID=595589 RepID=A0A2T0X882_9RHOB|nr:penicillin acylase family protein [Hasllibacter halocynthiae]PRY95161.1 penicillin amidase [Hasllibacter halocynthiae]